MKFVPIICVLLIAACNTPSSKLPKQEASALLSKFKELSDDSLEVYSPNLENNTDVFYGTPLDSSDISLFRGLIYETPPEPSDFFACYKFSLNENTIGLIVRTPAMYVSSSVKLFLYDIASQTVTEGSELAESWGDGGDAQVKRSFIHKLPDHSFQALIWNMQSHDNSIESATDITVTSKNSYFLVKIGSKMDTISRDSASLAAKYKELKMKIAGR